jgi:hypothetical protein
MVFLLTMNTYDITVGSNPTLISHLPLVDDVETIRKGSESSGGRIVDRISQKWTRKIVQRFKFLGS